MSCPGADPVVRAEGALAERAPAAGGREWRTDEKGQPVLGRAGEAERRVPLERAQPVMPVPVDTMTPEEIWRSWVPAATSRERADWRVRGPCCSRSGARRGVAASGRASAI